MSKNKVIIVVKVGTVQGVYSNLNKEELEVEVLDYDNLVEPIDDETIITIENEIKGLNEII